MTHGVKIEFEVSLRDLSVTERWAVGGLGSESQPRCHGIAQSAQRGDCGGLGFNRVKVGLVGGTGIRMVCHMRPFENTKSDPATLPRWSSREHGHREGLTVDHAR